MTASGSEVDGLRGLSGADAAERLRREGYNELPSAQKRGFFRTIYDVVREPMLLILVTLGALYLSIGSLEDALMLLVFVFVIIGITIVQERKTEHALEALQDLSSPRVSVIRDGRRLVVAGREVVRDDVILLAEGNRVPADAVLLTAVNLSLDESLLTGESVPVRKAALSDVAANIRRDGEDQPYVFSGTLVVQGEGLARVTATGPRTEIGKIGKALEKAAPEQTFLDRETGRLVRNLSALGVALCVIVVIVYGWTRKDWLDGILAGLTLAMTILPAEFPVLLTIFLALGAWRIAQKQVLTRRIKAIEALGSITTLCSDKTGTITMNRMAVSRLSIRDDCWRADSGISLPEQFHPIVEFAILASVSNPTHPIEKAFRELGEGALRNTEHLHGNWQLVQEYPREKELLAMSRVWQSPDGSEYVIAAKGAPEAVVDLCHLSSERRRKIFARVQEMAEDGLLVIGVARSRFHKTKLPSIQHEFTFDFIGLAGLQDPVRPGIREAVRECYRAGISVAMITGDYPETAKNIARQIGLAATESAVTGAELEGIDEAALSERVARTTIFARVIPEQKLRIVRALQRNGESVAMTGDGINDAPALKAADIGIAMGSRGTDVAREAASLVLLDDDFTSIVRTIRMGRRIFDNLKKAMAYILAVHVPIAGISLLPVLFEWPLVLLPVHIAFLELIIDPATSVAFEAEPEEADVMSRPPHDLRKPLFDRRTVMLSLLQGISVFLIVGAVYVGAILSGQGLDTARALAFTTLIIGNLALILTNRSWSRTIFSTLGTRNPALWAILAGAAFFLGLVLYLPLLRQLFHFGPLHPHDLLMCLGAGLVSIAWFELLKAVRNRRRRMQLSED